MISQATTSARPQILRAATIVMLFYIASRVLGLLRDIVISHQFGTSRELDAYFAAFSVTDLIFNVIAGGALGSAFIPTFSAALASQDQARAWRLASSILNVAMLVLIATAALAALFAPELVSATVARGFSAEDQALTATLVRWMLVTPVVFGLSGILMGILNSYHHFVLPALAPVLYNLAIIVGALVLAPSMGVFGLAAGVVAGAFFHLLVQVPWLVRRKMKYTLALGLRNPDVRHVGRLMLPRTLGLAAIQINFFVNTILASSLPAGRIAALRYAWVVMLLPEGIIALSLATAVFPTLSRLNARKELRVFADTFESVFRTTLYLTIPAAVGLIALSKPLIALLFQRGQFDVTSTAETAYALQFYALGLFAHSGLEIAARAYYAMHDTKTPVLLSIGSVLLNILLSIILIIPLAHGGLALANSIATILEMLVLLVILYRRLGSSDSRRLTRSLGRSTLGAAIMGGVLLLLTPLAGQFGNTLIGLVGILVGAAIYGLVTSLMGSEETVDLVRRIKQLRSSTD